MGFNQPKLEPPSLEDWESFVSYEESTGKLFWKQDRANSVKAGSEAGTYHLGYVRLKLGKGKYLAHRVVFLLNTGAWPIGVVDHIDHNTANNTFANLRDLSSLENSNNTALKKVGVSLPGVDFRDGKFRARIRIGNKLHSLGTFTTEDDAHKCYVAAKSARPGAILVVESHNPPQPPKLSGTGEKQVYFNRSGFQVKIGKSSYGTYPTLAEAVKVRNKKLLQESIL